MKVEILGTGCYNCLKLEEMINQLVLELGKSGIEIERVSDERRIRNYMPLDEIPGLVIDGHLVSTAQLPAREELVRWFAPIQNPAG
jgi:Thioredoxin domain